MVATLNRDRSDVTLCWNGVDTTVVDASTFAARFSFLSPGPAVEGTGSDAVFKSYHQHIIVNASAFDATGKTAVATFGYFNGDFTPPLGKYLIKATVGATKLASIGESLADILRVLCSGEARIGLFLSQDGPSDCDTHVPPDAAQFSMFTASKSAQAACSAAATKLAAIPSVLTRIPNGGTCEPARVVTQPSGRPAPLVPNCTVSWRAIVTTSNRDRSDVTLCWNGVNTTVVDATTFTAKFSVTSPGSATNGTGNATVFVGFHYHLFVNASSYRPENRTAVGFFGYLNGDCTPLLGKYSLQATVGATPSSRMGVNLARVLKLLCSGDAGLGLMLSQDGPGQCDQHIRPNTASLVRSGIVRFTPSRSAKAACDAMAGALAGLRMAALPVDADDGDAADDDFRSRRRLF